MGMGKVTPVGSVLVDEFVTGGGLAGEDLPASWAIEGRAMRRAAAAEFAALTGLRVTMTLDARLPDEPGPWRVVRVGPGEDASTLARLAGEADCTLLIAPETGGTLAARARLVAEAGGRSLGATPSAIALAGDKLRLGHHLAALGIKTPPCWPASPAEGLPDGIPYPAVLKPVDGAGSIDTFYLADARSCPDEARSMSRALLQPFVAGLPMSASLLVSHDGRAHLVAIGEQRVEVQGDRFVYLGGRVPAETWPPCDEIVRAVEAVPGLRGYVGVDFVWTAGDEVVVIEINPRLTTSFAGLCRQLPAGALARAWLAALDPDAALDLPDLAARLRRRRPLTFLADGTVAGPDGTE